MIKKIIMLTGVALCASSIMHGGEEKAQPRVLSLGELCRKEIAQTITMDLDTFKARVAAISSEEEAVHLAEKIVKRKPMLQQIKEILPPVIQDDIVATLHSEHRDEKPFLIWAIYENKADIIEMILASKNSEILNEKNITGWTALMVAAEFGRTEIVQALINAGADLNLQANNGCTALYVAAQNGHTEIVQALINAKADINIQANGDWTALRIAARYGRTEIVQALIDADAELNLQANNGCTALYVAAQFGRTETVQALINAGANLNLQANNGWTALMSAAYHGRTEIVQALIDADAELNLQANNGCTALMIAERNRHTEVINIISAAQQPTAQALMQTGADLNIQNDQPNQEIAQQPIEVAPPSFWQRNCVLIAAATMVGIPAAMYWFKKK